MVKVRTLIEASSTGFSADSAACRLTKAFTGLSVGGPIRAKGIHGAFCECAQSVRGVFYEWTDSYLDGNVR